jgi:hypothetical protein
MQSSAKHMIVTVDAPFGKFSCAVPLPAKWQALAASELKMAPTKKMKAKTPKKVEDSKEFTEAKAKAKAARDAEIKSLINDERKLVKPGEFKARGGKEWDALTDEKKASIILTSRVKAQVEAWLKKKSDGVEIVQPEWFKPRNSSNKAQWKKLPLMTQAKIYFENKMEPVTTSAPSAASSTFDDF